MVMSSTKAMRRIALEDRSSMSWNSRKPESKQIGSPAKKATKQEIIITLIRLLRSLGNSSMMDAMKASHEPQTDEMARRISMKKNMNENRGETSMTVTASG